MFFIDLSRINADEFSRHEERKQMSDGGKSLGPIQENDVVIKEAIYQALWNDDVLRAIEYSDIDIHVKNGVVYLIGHIANTSSLSRIVKAVRNVPGILDINNNLVLDEKLTLEVATSLGTLEHTYDCKFFTGVSHGVVSLNGVVSNEKVKLMAEKCAASNPNVRGVINHVRVKGSKPELQDQPFLQPTTGEMIYFLDGISGAIKQVIINPNTRCVIAMTVQGKFSDQEQDLESLNNGETQPPERLIVLHMSAIRYLTRVSGFLNINSKETDQFVDFDPSQFTVPNENWLPPYPYCSDDVLFHIKYKKAKRKITNKSYPFPFAVKAEDGSYRQQFISNGSMADTKNTMLTKRKLTYFFRRRIHGRNTHKDLDLTISRSKKNNFEIENILRWEDDGGQISGWSSPVDRSDHPAATQANKIMQVSTTTHIDTFNEKSEKQAYQVYKDEYLVNDSLGG